MFPIRPCNKQQDDKAEKRAQLSEKLHEPMPQAQPKSNPSQPPMAFKTAKFVEPHLSPNFGLQVAITTLHGDSKPPVSPLMAPTPKPPPTPFKGDSSFHLNWL